MKHRITDQFRFETLLLSNKYEMCLQKGEGVPKHLKRAEHYFKFAVDQGLVVAQYMVVWSSNTYFFAYFDTFHKKSLLQITSTPTVERWKHFLPVGIFTVHKTIVVHM
jgi:hypothetical protein